MQGENEELATRLSRAAQTDLPLVEAPFRRLADSHGLEETELLQGLREWMREGIIRRYGALVSHRKLGFHYNALVVWQVPPERVEEVGRALAEDPDITHCYERPPALGFLYNLYTMIHTHTEEECRRKVQHLAAMLDLPVHEVLVSLRELKKASPRYGSAPVWGPEDEDDVGE